MISKISPLSGCKILGVFVNTLTADDKYPVWDCENLPPLASNAMTLKSNFFFFFFCQFLGPFVQSTSNFKHF